MAVIIFKPVERCNSNCVYCDVVKKNQETIMSEDMLELLFRRIDEYLRGCPDERVSLTWHGGEVCLLGAQYFDLAFNIQRRTCAGTIDRIEHLVQSNLTLMTQEIIDRLRALGIQHVGSSYEPLPHIRGFGPARDSDAYNRLFFRGTDLLAANGFQWGVIYVVHRGSLPYPLDLFYFLTNLNPGRPPNFNPIYVDYKEIDPLHVTPREFADFLGTIFPVWWKTRERYMNIRPFSEITESILTGTPKVVCNYSGQCANHWAYVGPTGETSQCGRAGDCDMISYGNLRERSLRDVLFDPRRDLFKRRQAMLPHTECAGCRFWRICHGGCPLDSYSRHGTFERVSPNCEFIKAFVGEYVEPVMGKKAAFQPTAEDLNLILGYEHEP